MAKKKINVNGIDISVLDNKYISLTDLAKTRSETPNDVIKSWMHSKATLGYLRAWEVLNNKDFKQERTHLFKGFTTIQEEFMENSYTMYPSKWNAYTNGIAFIVKQGKYGGSWAHSDIALAFASWLSPELHLFVNMEFQRLKQEELKRLGDPYNLKRNLVGGNYQLMIGSILEKMDERLLTHPQPYKSRLPFAAEADLLNQLVFGQTAKEWHKKNPDKPSDRNQRDYANIIDLSVLNNLEFLNALLIRWEMDIDERQAILKEVYEWMYPLFSRFKTMQKLQDLANRYKK